MSQDIEILKNLIRRVESNDGCNAEQLLPDFYAEHVTLAMNRERRKQALVRVLHLIRQDLERERRGREGLETLHRAFIATPAFAADESTQNVTEKLHHVRLLLCSFFYHSLCRVPSSKSVEPLPSFRCVLCYCIWRQRGIKLEEHWPKWKAVNETNIRWPNIF